MKRKGVRDQALSFLEHRDRTEQELCRKLKEKEYQPEEIADTVQFLKEYGYLNDAEYARRYVRTYGERKSIRKLRADLEQKGVGRGEIEAALETVSVDENAQICRYLERKLPQEGEQISPAEYRRLTAALARRGFSYEAIRREMSAYERTWQ